MCVLAMAWRDAVDHLAEADPTRVRRISGRFVNPVIPPQELTATFRGPERRDDHLAYGFQLAVPSGVVIKRALVEILDDAQPCRGGS